MKRARTGKMPAGRMRKKQRTAGVFKAPRRAYSGSMVPLRTGGYRPNSVERKVADLVTATYQVNTSGSFTLLANPTLGSDFTNRIGRKIVLKSFYIRGYIAQEKALAEAPAGAPAQYGRMIVFCDLQPNGAAPAVTDLLVEAKPQSQLNLNNRDRFVILTDKNYVLDPWFLSTTATQSYASCSNNIKLVKKYKKISVETIYNATNGGTIADINSGALYMFWIGDQNGVADDLNAIVSTRVRYIDA